MESSNVYTLSLRNKRNCRTSFSTSKRGNTSCIIAIRNGWLSDSMECYCYLWNVQRPPGRRENSVRTKIWRIFQRTIYSIWEYFPNSEWDKAGIHQFGKKALPRIFLGYALIAGEIWQGDILIADIEESEKLDASGIYPRRLDAKEVLITQKDGEFIVPVTDGSATLSGRHYEFQESTLRREHTVKRESHWRISWP